MFSVRVVNNNIGSEKKKIYIYIYIYIYINIKIRGYILAYHM